MKFTIKGMHCPSCKLLVEDILEDLNIKVNSLTVDEKKQIGILDAPTNNPQALIKEIEAETGYEVSYEN